MKLSKHLVSLLFLIILLNSCGEKSTTDVPEGFTRVRFSQESKAILNGGVMVYIQNQNNKAFRGSSFLSTEAASSPKDITLPNGPYKFTAVGFANYNGGEQLYNAQTYYCGAAFGGQNVELAGGVADIPITLTTTGCDNDVFAPAGYRSGGVIVNVTEIGNCLDPIAGGTPLSTCTGSGGVGSVGYFRVELVEFSPAGPVNDPLSTFQIRKNLIKSMCITVNGVASLTGNAFKVPYGIAGFPPYAVSVTKHSDAGCTTVVREYPFKLGLLHNGAAADGKNALTYLVVGPAVQIYTQD